MNKRIAIIVTSLILLAASVVLLLVFILQPSKNNNMSASTIILSVTNQKLKVGEEVTDFYYINRDDCEIVFEWDENSGIIDINEERIIGLRQGIVNVKMIAKNSEDKAEANFSIEVEDNNISFNILAIDECDYNQNCILDVYSNICLFTFTIDVDNKTLTTPPKFNVRVDDDIKCDIDATIITLIGVHDGVMTFTFPEYNYSLAIDIVCHF